MHTRLAQRLSVAALLVAGVTLAGAGAAQAATTAAPAMAGGWHGHHHSENCNNDPDSEFAMDPYVCPPSHNYGAHYEEHGYAGDYYGYGYPRY
jgi:hypothetical protein